MIAKRCLSPWLKYRIGQDQCYKCVLVGKDYRDHSQLRDVEVAMFGKKTHASAYVRCSHKRLCKRHSTIEAVIGHLKSDYSMGKNYLRGNVGGKYNALLASIGRYTPSTSTKR